MQTTPTKDELVQLENQYWQAIQDSDVETALQLTDFPCLVAGSQGIASFDRTAFAGMMKSGSWKLEKFELKDAEVRFLSQDIALLAYTVHEELSVDGKRLTVDAADASTWVRRDGRWRCALHTESLSGDPFGRDRIVRDEASANALAAKDAVASLA